MVSSSSGQQPERMLAGPNPVLYREVRRKPPHQPTRQVTDRAAVVQPEQVAVAVQRERHRRVAGPAGDPVEVAPQ
jgi:hypothetical protein